MIESITIRLHFYKEAINAFLSEPITGIGWGEFGYYLYLNADSAGMDRNAHNIILHFLAETGLIGTLCLIGALICYYPEKFYKKYVPLYGIIGIQIVHSMVEFPYAYMQWLIVLGLCIGMINAKQ